MIVLAERPPQDAEANIARALQCVVDRAAVRSAVAAEHIRAMLYGAWVAPPGSNSVSSVHTTRLLKNARRAIDLMWPCDPLREASSEDDLCAATLQNMQLIGDAVDVGHGQWIATPLHIIVPDGASNCMILGSAPLAALWPVLRSPISCAGASRFMSGESLSKSQHRDILHTVDDWLGPAPSLSAWTTQVLASHETRMEALQGLSAEQLELYAPDIARSQRRTGRWIPAGHVGHAIDGVRLCRPRGTFARTYSRPHFLAHFDFAEGALSVKRSAPIAHELTLRLRFGLDLLLNTPRQISVVASAQTFSIERPSPLPDPESRVYALGWSDSIDTAPSERLTFRSYAMPFVLHALQRLLITPQIVQRQIQ